MSSILVLGFMLGAVSPIDIDTGRQLFVDDYLIASTQGLVRVYNHPTKMFDAPVIWPESEAEREIDPARGERWAPVAAATSGGLWWDPERKRFRLWYESGWMHRLSYAESEDGLVWTRPDCGIVPGTNLLVPEQDLDSWSVFPDYGAANPYRNWFLMISVAGGVTDNLLYTAEDGVHWKKIGEAGQSGDRTTLFYDPFRGEWVFSLRGESGRGGRVRSRWTSRTFGGPSCLWNFRDGKGPGKHPDLPEPKLWLDTDGADLPDARIAGAQPKIYNMDAVAYESLMVGVFELLHNTPHDNTDCVRQGMPKITDLHFAYSRDGVNYFRPDRSAAIPASRWGSGKWDTGYLSPIGGICVIKDERLWFYYTGMRGDATERGLSKRPGAFWRPNGMHYNASIGVATLRRDGFVGLVADGRGEVVTRPVRFSGGHLFVNAECRFGGLEAEVLDEQGAVIPGFAAKEARPLLLTDTTKAEIVWPKADLAILAGRSVRFRFKVHCGTLYSFWVSADKSGRSGGYLAGGGPAYPGLRDTDGRDGVPSPPASRHGR